MVKVLFVCFGNIMRSQIAEAFYNKYTKSEDAISAGNNPITLEKYPNIPNETIDSMKEIGIDISEQKPKLITPQMVSEVSQIFIMCRKEECPNYLFSSDKCVFWEIEDPYRKGSNFLRKIRAQIESKVLSII